MVARDCAWRAPLSTLMSPASIMSFACGISSVSAFYSFFISKQCWEGRFVTCPMGKYALFLPTKKTVQLYIIIKNRKIKDYV